MSPAVIRRLAVPLLAVAALAVTAACADDAEGDAAPSGGDAGRPTSGGELVGPAPEGIDGVQAYRVDSNDHTEDDLAYQLVPPVGGDHFPVPATCGFYETDVPPDEMIVHDLEHGAVWIAFAPDLDDGQQATLRDLVTQQAKVMATPRDGLPGPVVVSAWGRQLTLDSVGDPRLVQFVDTYRPSPDAPEPSAASQGVGEPAVLSPAG